MFYYFLQRKNIISLKWEMVFWLFSSIFGIYMEKLYNLLGETNRDLRGKIM